MSNKPRRDIAIPPANYSAVDLQMMKLRSIPAKLEAEEMNRRRFAEVEMTGIFAGVLSPELKAEEQAAEEFWRKWEADQEIANAPRRSLFGFLGSFFNRRPS